jgi:hypothetical protein
LIERLVKLVGVSRIPAPLLVSLAKEQLQQALGHESAMLEAQRALADLLTTANIADVLGDLPMAELPRLRAMAGAYAANTGPVSELVLGQALTADRVGFLFAQDFAASVSQLNETAAESAGVSMSQAVRELMLFSVSTELFELRQELALTVDAASATQVFA